LHPKTLDRWLWTCVGVQSTLRRVDLRRSAVVEEGKPGMDETVPGRVARDADDYCLFYVGSLGCGARTEACIKMCGVCGELYYTCCGRCPVCEFRARHSQRAKLRWRWWPKSA
jgi:hypothetical protein